jgi:BlaI family transcriptional regulator, penicillinase repressor
MDVIYARRQATATDVVNDLADAPSRTAVRTFLRILEEKGHLKHRKEGREFVYAPTHPKSNAAKSALRRVLSVFFEGSLEKAVASHLADPGAEMSKAELKRLASLISQARKKGE